MTPEQRLDRAERIIVMMAKAGQRARLEWRVRSREQDERINILINTQIRNDERFEQQRLAVNEQMLTVNEQIKALAVAQIELTESQKLTDRALRAYINSQRKRDNGNSST